MSTSDLDVEALAGWLERSLGVRLASRRAVSGGCIHRAWCLELEGGGRLFAKVNSADALPWLEAEADGLAALQGAALEAALAVPQPLALERLGDQAVLVLSWLEFASAPVISDVWRQLGAALAGLHRHSRTVRFGPSDRGCFGWWRDNVIGSGHQANGWSDDWPRFFAERRLAPQFERLERSGGALAGSEAVLEGLPQWLGRHSVEACLVHGDLWSGNAGVLADGRGALFDPAIHRGDREVDLAMARLFGGFPAAFFEGYQASWPLPRGHQRRQDLYNLYHLLNHANLFGGGYRHQAQNAIRRLLKNQPD
ncbi:MAG: fructosamine kinase family protein [Synechococcaceae cyanobacterium]|nr:fructosamine kinase family protein [Synechococcaceae cyanobacterium]